MLAWTLDYSPTFSFMAASSQRTIDSKTILLVLGIMLIAANLRGPMTSIAPLFETIRVHFSLSASTVALLTSLPLLILAIVSPFCARLARRFGLERVLFFAMCIMASGIILRSTGSLFWLFAGTALIGVGIALGNVLLPAMVKRDFPGHIALMTASYALIMGIAAAIISALVVPLSQQLSSHWMGALSSAGVFTFLAIIVWLPQLGSATRNKSMLETNTRPLLKPIWRYALAWQVTFFLACNSAVYYTMVSWLPEILRDSGLDSSDAGKLHGLMQLTSAAAGILQLLILHRLRDQRLLAFATTGLSALALYGLWVAPAYAAFWSALFGFGNGATFILALAFFGLRTNNASQAAALSGMAQAVTYSLAAIAPWLMGLLHDSYAGWREVFILCLLLNTGIACFGLFAGRDIQLQPLKSATPSNTSH